MTMKKIALEEAITTPATESYAKASEKLVPAEDQPKLQDALANSDKRIAAMDAAGIDIFVLSQTSPGVQAETNADLAVQRASQSNKEMRDEINQHPTRYRGFANLAMQNVQAACDELKKCVEEYGFLGALINGQTGGLYLDDDSYKPFWESVNQLGVPVYIHPGDPYTQPDVMEGYEIMQGAVWGWGTDTSTHFLRLLFSGLFDRLPELAVILGHMGEMLPYFAYRLDSRYAVIQDPVRPRLKKNPSEYLRSNLFITTSGVCQDSALQCAIAEMGEDRVLFSIDYPYEDATNSSSWIDKTPLTDVQRQKICYKNAEQALRLGLATHA
jgi:2,3-dihydroxybenzoate decarboxylase